MERLQEEGEYEEAAYYPDTNGQKEPYAEEVQLVQPLLGSSSEGEAKTDSHMVTLCGPMRTAVGCAKYVFSLFLKEFTGSVLHNAEVIGKWEKKVIHSVIGHIRSALGYRNPTGHDAACAAFGAGVNLALKDSPFGVTNAVGVAAALGCAALFHF